ncbi:hypothetical protein ZIOFF_062419 [Zingiber officinale]|uniref:DUF4216 domain-containing protein n=1 Tax=Zingiber officinale TaxID=94328 RepID=A0A8J5F0C3_ZINOF|nr:hypothetical protein ZIOFF_062419 [Zingiber officinale]
MERACSAPSISSSVPSRDNVDNMEGLVHDAFGVQQHNGSTINTVGFEKDKDIPFGEAEKFYKLIDDSQKELYPGSDYVETRFNQSMRNDDTTIGSTFALDVFTASGYALGKVIATKFDDETLKKAHQYVLFNCHHVQSYIDEHRQILNLSHSGLPPHQIERMHSESFASWFEKHIENTNLSQDDPISNDLKSLARDPNFIGIQYEKFLSNGYRFHTKEVERKRKTHNCGVIVRATTSSYSSIRDQNPISSELDYYGILQNVIELDYEGGRRVVLFECDWVSKDSQNIQGASNNQIVETSNQKDNDVQDCQNIQGASNNQIDETSNQKDNDVQDCQNIQDASNNQIDETSNQKDIELQASNKIVENDFMDEEFDQGHSFSKLMEKCLNDAKLDNSNVHDVVLADGSTRIPKVQSFDTQAYHFLNQSMQFEVEHKGLHARLLSVVEQHKRMETRIVKLERQRTQLVLSRGKVAATLAAMAQLVREKAETEMEKWQKGSRLSLTGFTS